jgi:ferritin-like metal-binding protein YciE
MERLEAWCMDEIRRLEDARAHLAWLLEEMEEAATLPLLRDTLQEQRGTIAAQRERFTRLYAALGLEPGGLENPIALAMAHVARESVRSLDGAQRDVVIAQHAVRFETWELGVWAGLYRVLRQVGRHQAADEVEALVGDLRSAERHLEAVHPDVPEEEGQERRATIRHRPRLSLNIGPAE